MITKLQVREVQFRNELVGYRVGGLYRDCPDSLWDPIFHEAIFRSREAAERLLRKVCAVPCWNYDMKRWSSGEWDGAFSVL